MLLPKLLSALLLLPAILSAQSENEKQSGNFSLGVRSAVSAFSNDDDSWGYGAGGQFRIQFTDRINTEWFLDVLSTSIENQAQKMDYHIGWSVMYYLIDTKGFSKKVTPYVVAGHCFDYTRFNVNRMALDPTGSQTLSRWSSAVQAGIGFHYNITPRFDLSPTAQVMMHFGKDLHLEMVGDNTAAIAESHHVVGGGHLLFNVSMNYKFGKLWKPKKS